MVRTETDLPPHITFEQFKTIYHGLAGNFKDQILCGLMWETGGRITDIVSLRWKDFNLDTRLLTLFVNKKDTTITIPIGMEMISDLKNYQSTAHPNKEDYLFPSPIVRGHYEGYNKKHLTRTAAYEKIKSWGVKFLQMQPKPPGNLHPHMFRHGLAIYLLYNAELQGGLEGRLKIIASRLGHTSIQTTERYYLVITPELQRWSLQNVPMR